MLSATLVTLATLLLDLSNSSPVYNMQPAFITANIGTTGRNIRNLPCISRKNNQSGVCMFAIDCLKANGTHLGTCIDRFYFGSCCHIEPVHDIIENTIIDSDLIPSREPPLRVSSTTATSIPSSTVTTLNNTADSIINVISKLGAQNITSTTTESSSTATATAVSETQSKSTTSSKPLVSILTTTPSKPSEFSTITSLETTTAAQKLQTFQSVDGSSTTPESTTKPIRTTTSKPLKPVKPPTKAPSKVTTKPIPQKPTQTKPTLGSKPTGSKPTAKPKPSRPLITTSKPVKVTKPTINKPVQKPVKPITGRPSITTKKPTQTTNKTTVKVTRKPSSTTPKPVKKVTSTTAQTTTTGTTTTTTSTTTESTTTKREPVTTKLESTTSAPVLTTTPLPQVTTKEPIPQPSVTPSNVSITKLNVTSILETVNGNPATNEIEAKPALTTEKPSMKPSLVTWTVDDNRNTTTSSPANNESDISSTTEDWVPITTPDGWVLLPIVPSNTTVSQESSTSESPILSSTIIPSTVASNITTTQSKPSTSYIPLQTTAEPPPSTTLVSSSSENITSATNESAATTTAVPLSQSTSEPENRPLNMSDFTNVCGRRMFPEARIVGGEKSPFGKWPWQISLRQWRTSTYLHKCGAALLNENWAITAAHCVDNVPPSDLLLRLGEHDLSTESEPYLHQERRVQIVASHPQFDPRTFEYDLALLRFYEPVTFQPNILPVCVPQTDENFVGRTAYVTGWGRLYEDGPLPSVLQEVSVPVINNTVCESMYRSAGYIEHIPHIFICAGWRRGGFDSCEGDSGGPMVIQRDDKRFLLAGVISWGIGCAEPNQPGVYTRISEFRDWINQILQF